MLERHKLVWAVSYGLVGAGMVVNGASLVVNLSNHQLGAATVNLAGLAFTVCCLAWVRLCDQAIAVARRAQEAADHELDAVVAASVAAPVALGSRLPKPMKVAIAQMAGDALINYVHTHFERRSYASDRPDPREPTGP